MSAEHVFSVAEGYLGVTEYPAAKHNPQILKFYADSGNSWVQDDETPWCAAFVGSVLAQCGIQGTNKLNARSYLDWGQPIDTDKAQKGDVVVFWRGSKDGWQGHVAFYSHQDEEHIYVLGGNQGNKVSLAPYKKDRLLGIRTVRQPRQHVAESKTVQATAVQVAGAATTGVTAIAALDGTAQLVVIGAVAIVTIAALFILKERILKWQAGDR